MLWVPPDKEDSPLSPKRTRIPFSQHETENHLVAWKEKRPPFLWGLIGSKCGTNSSDFAEVDYYTQKSKDAPISTDGLVEMMHNFPGRKFLSLNLRIHIHGPTGRTGLTEI